MKLSSGNDLPRFSLGGLTKSVVTGAVLGGAGMGISDALSISPETFMAAAGGFASIEAGIKDEDSTVVGGLVQAGLGGAIGAGIGWCRGYVMDASANLFPNMSPMVAGAMGGAVVSGAVYLALAGLSELARDA